MQVLKSLIYRLFFYAGVSVTVVILGFTLLARDWRVTYRGIARWSAISFRVLERLCGLKLVMTGRDKLPFGEAFIISPKHESTLDAFSAIYFFPEVTALAKHQLYLIPIVGPVLKKIGIIKIRRGTGKAHKRLPGNLGDSLRKQGRALMVYPEGTRVPAGEEYPLKSGVWHLHKEHNLPVYTVASNSGYFWPVNRFTIRPGTVIFEVHDAIPQGLDKDAFMKELHKRVVERSRQLHALADRAYKKRMQEKK